MPSLSKTTLAVLACLALAGLPCGAEQRVVTTAFSSPSDELSSLARFERGAKTAGYLVVLEKGEEGPLRKAVRSLSRDEAIFAYRVPMQVVDPEAPGMARELAEREHWEGQPRWVLFAPTGRMVFCSQEVPTLRALLQAFQDSGFTPLRQRLEAFLKANPERQDALLDLCAWEALLASRRLAPLLNPTNQASMWSEAARPGNAMP